MKILAIYMFLKRNQKYNFKSRLVEGGGGVKIIEEIAVKKG